MELYIDSDFDNETKDLLEKAVTYFVEDNLPPYIVKNLDISIMSDNDMENAADIIFISKREYAIHINVKKSLSTIISSVMHELVHLEQHTRGHLKHIDEVTVQFRNKKYSLPLTSYYKRPWEIEAYGREVGLYIEFIQHIGESAQEKWQREK